MRRVPPTERVHPDGLDLNGLPMRALVARLHAGDREAVRAVGRAVAALAALADEVARALAAGGRLIYAGAGTSGRLGALDAAECPPTFGIAPSRVLALVAGGSRALRRAVEGAEDDRDAGVAAIRRAGVGPGDLLVGITASGTTPFVLAALTEARRRRARTALLTSNPGARVQVDHRVLLDTGPERVAGSTRMKAGAAAKMALGLLSTAVFVRLGTVHRGRMVALRPASEKLRRRAVRTVSEVGGVSAAAARAALRASDWSVREALRAVGTDLPQSSSPPGGAAGTPPFRQRTNPRPTPGARSRKKAR